MRLLRRSKWIVSVGSPDNAISRSHVLAKFVSHQTLTKQSQVKLWTLYVASFCTCTAARCCSDFARFSLVLVFWFGFLSQSKCALTRLTARLHVGVSFLNARDSSLAAAFALNPVFFMRLLRII